MRYFLFICSLFVALAAACPSALHAAGAIAIGRCDRNGYAFNHPNQSAAMVRALAECRANGDRSCEVVLRIHKSCGAFAVSGNGGCGARGWAYALNRAAAENLAISYCAGHGGRDCRIQSWVCDGGP